MIKDIDLNQYDYLIKLHTKRDMHSTIVIIDNKYFFKGIKWRDYLLSFLKSKKRFNQCLDAFEKDQKLGMINFYRLFDRSNDDSKDPHQYWCMEQSKKCLSKVNLKANPSTYVRYIAGTMFMCRASLLNPIKQLNLSLNNFSEPNRKNENDSAHIVERLFGWVITSQGYSLDDPYSTTLDKLRQMPHSLWCRFLSIPNRYRLVTKVLRFIYRVDRLEHEDIYRVFKIAIKRTKH